jgi:CDP-diacylglycerol--serine O-phosphatidyltransferase
MFVLPNLFTVGNIFCGFFAVTLCLGDPGPVELRRAAIAIFFGSFFDMFDGRVARLTKTQSEFGVQLDSLADLATFGVAPAVLLHRWCLGEMGFWGLIIAFLYVAGGALRLARFNVIASREAGTSKHFLGLPIPLAAGTVVSLVLASYPAADPRFGGTAGTAAITLGLAVLMVSNVHYRAFKDLKPSKKSISIVFVLILLFAGISAQLRPTGALAVFFVGYIALGLVEEVVFFRRRRLAAAEAHDDEEEDEDLAEGDEEFVDDDEDDEEATVPPRSAENLHPSP